ncbi:unnamed protein product, partial [Didymodactylos carnosus]
WCFIDNENKCYLTMDDAEKSGWISKQMKEHFEQPCGLLNDQKDELTLKNAIRLGLIDLKTNSLMNLKLNQQILDINNSVNNYLFSLNNGRERYLNLVYIQLETHPRLKRFATLNGSFETRLTLTDCLELDLIDLQTGYFINPTNGFTMPLSEATKKGFLHSDINEIVLSHTQEKITLSEALESGIITSPNGYYFDLTTKQQLTLTDALKHRLLEKPYTLSMAFVNDMIDHNNQILSFRTGKRLTLADAIKRNILDDHTKHIIHPVTKKLLSLIEAQKINLITIDGYVIDPNTKQKQTLYDCVRTNRIQLVTLKPTCKGALIKDTTILTTTNSDQQQRLISLGEAIPKGLIDLNKNLYIDKQRENGNMTIDQAIEMGYIVETFQTDVMKDSGLIDQNNKPLSVLEGIRQVGKSRSVDINRFEEVMTITIYVID